MVCRFIVLCTTAFLLAVCGSSGSHAPAQASSSSPGVGVSDGHMDAVATFEQMCMKDNSWAADFQKTTGRLAVVRVAVIGEDGMAAIAAESLRGRIEKVLLDSDAVQVAASFGDMAQMQQLQMLSDEPSGTEQLGADFMITARISETVEPSADGEVLEISTTFRVVEVETSAMACVCMAREKKAVEKESAVD